ncbi:MAG: PAS domain S-box protein [Anaerolineaceae bacterium]|nr:PAS domain S-box protein [Anaerolineaceae bacterium]
MRKPLKALILEDSENDILLLLRELRRGDFDIDHFVVSNASDMRAALSSGDWDIILSDYAMGGFDALAALKIVQEFRIDIPFIIISGTVGEDTAVKAMKAGASDFFAKDKLTRLVPAVERELREAAGRRKRAQAEARFTTAFQASPVGTVISRLSDGLVMDVNARFLKSYGLTRDEVVGKRRGELELWEGIDRTEEVVQELRTQGSVNGIEIAYRHTSGRLGYALMSAELIELDNEMCILSMIHDITDRKEAETAIEASEEKFRLLAENSTDMITRYSAEGQFLYVSPACQSLLGYEPDELIGHSAYEFLHPDDIEIITQVHRKVLEHPAVYTTAYRNRHKTGRYVWFETISRTMVDAGTGKVLEIQAASRDISARKEDEQALERYAQRLELLHDIDLAILRGEEPKPVAELVLQRLQVSMAFDNASITMFDADTQQYLVLATFEPIPDYQPNEDIWLTIDQLKRNEIYTVDNLQNNVQLPNDQVLKRAGFQSYVRIPLLSSGNLLGTFMICAREPHIFLEEELNVAKEVASQLAIVIENARLLKVEQRRNSELEALHQASLELTSSLDLERVLTTVLDYAILLIHANDAHIFLYKDNTLTFGAAQWDGERHTRPIAEPRPEGLTYTVAKSGQRMIVPDVNQHSSFANWQWGGAIIGLPLRYAGEVNGVMSIALLQPHYFAEHEIRLLELLADQAAIAIHNAQLYQQVQSHAKELEQHVLERTQELQRARDRVIAILNSSSDSVILANSQGLIQQTNPGFNRQFGYDQDELFDRPMSSVIAPESLDLFRESMGSIGNNRESKRIEVVVQRKNETTFPADTLISSFAEGDERMVVYSLRDISRLKQVELELRSALEAEKELNQLKTSFTSIVSHEFRTPLSVILASSDSLLTYYDRMDQQRRVEKLEKINQQVQRLIRLMNDVLTITRSESVGFDFRPRNLDVIPLCQEIIEDVKVVYKPDANITFSAEGKCESVNIDEFLFSHILQNLTSNAVKYSKSDGQVDIHLNCSPARLILQVEDNGIGIPASHQAYLFQAFRRATNVGQIQGTGIGLTIVKRAVIAHGGKIDFSSVEGSGTTFTVTLPLSANKDQSN